MINMTYTARATRVQAGRDLTSFVGRPATLFAAALLACCVLLPLTATAQNVQHSKNSKDSGMRHDFKVDPVSLSLNVQITFGAYKGRGGSTIPVAMRYSSKLWRLDYDSHVVGGPVGFPDGNDYTKLNAVYGDQNDRMLPGWSSTLELPYVFTDQEWFDLSGMPCEFDKCRLQPTTEIIASYVRRVRLRMPDGSTHELRASDDDYKYNQHVTYPITYYAVDGSRLIYKETGDINQGGQGITYLPDGSRYITTGNGLGGGQFIDRHGNTLTCSASGVWTDALGRSFSLGSVPGVNNTTINHTFTYRQLKIEGHPEQSALTDFNQSLVHYGTWNGTTLNDTPGLFDSVSSVDRINSGGVFNPSVLYQIEAPDGSKYTFTYNLYGEIDKIVYPTGGYERFEYGAVEGVTAMNWPYTLTNRGVTKRWVSPDGTAAGEREWRYFAEPVNSSVLKTTAVAPDGTVTDKYIHRGLLPGVKYFGFDEAKSGMVFEECFYAPGAQHGERGAMLRRHLTEWGQADYVRQGAGVNGGFHVTRDPRVNKEVEVILDTNGGSALTKTTAYQYDGDLNVRETSEYGYERVPHSTGVANVGEASAIGSFQLGALLRTSEAVFLVNDPAVDSSTKEAYRARNLVSLPTSSLIKDGAGNIISQAATQYDERAYPVMACSGITGWADPQTAALGNATTAKVWLNTTNTWVETHTRYDQAGNVRESRDAHAETDGNHGHLSEFLYSTLYQYNYLEQAKTPAPDPTGVNGSNIPLVTSSTYDLKTGLVLTVTDANDQVTTFSYADAAGNIDPLSRLRKVTSPDGGWTAYEYGNTPNNYFVRTRASIDATRSTDSYQHVDGLGRPTRSYTYDGSAEDRVWVASKTTYDSMGRVAATSNPQFRSDLSDFTPSSGGITTREYDFLGRTVKVTTPDGASVTSAYVGNEVTATDQAGKSRKSVSDALGRLTAIYEDPTPGGLNYETSYEYDALGNLKNVTQGRQTRTFAYDSMGRLTSATNPEACQQLPSQCVPVPTAYEYNANGSLKKKTDERGITTTYTYDALNRVTLRNYSDSTPDVTYVYDAANVANSKGRLTSISSSVSVLNYTAYDEMGRVRGSQQVTDGQTYGMGYVYDRAGNLVAQTYPSGRVVRTEYDHAGRVSTVDSALPGQSCLKGEPCPVRLPNVISDMSYTAHGAVSDVKLGNGLLERYLYNSRLQPTEIGLRAPSSTADILKLNYSYETVEAAGTPRRDNNGDIRSQRITAPALDVTQSYEYDPLGRLSAAVEANNTTPCKGQDGTATCWRQVYKYDRYANRNFDAGTTFPMLPATHADMVNNPRVDDATNRLSEHQDMDGRKDYEYDAAGNVVRNALGQTFAYDGDNMQVSFNGGPESNMGGAGYAYDALGRRVKKVTPGGTTVYVYDAGGALVAEYSNVAPAPGAGGTKYLTADNLGSPRVVTDHDGKVVSRHDYAPFGEELPVGMSGRANGKEPGQEYIFGVTDDNINQQFTGQERDRESGLDYFNARYYSPAQGRFTSIDPLAASGRPGNPQTWNRYAYVLNNPHNLVDPTGMEPQTGNTQQTESRPQPQQPMPAPAIVVSEVLDRPVPVTNADGQAVGDAQVPAASKALLIGVVNINYSNGYTDQTNLLNDQCQGVAASTSVLALNGTAGSDTRTSGQTYGGEGSISFPWGGTLTGNLSTNNGLQANDTRTGQVAVTQTTGRDNAATDRATAASITANNAVYSLTGRQVFITTPSGERVTGRFTLQAANEVTYAAGKTSYERGKQDATARYPFYNMCRRLQ